MKNKNYPLSPEMQQLVGKQLHKIRHEKDEKLITIEAATGIAHSTITKIEKGQYPALTMGMLEKLANYHGVTLTHLTDPEKHI